MSLQKERVLHSTEIKLTPPSSKNKAIQFLKTIMNVATSFISYERKFFPRSNYEVQSVYGIPVNIIKSKTVQANTYKSWIESAMDPIEKNYLRKLVVNIENIENEVIECYSIKLKYNDEDQSLSNDNDQDEFQREHSKKKEQNYKNEVQKMVICMLKNIKTFTEQLEKLPDEYLLSVQLHYYDEKKPDYYHPTFYKELKEQTKFAQDADTVKLGSIVTNFNKTFLKGKSIFMKPIVTSEDEEIILGTPTE